MRCQSPGWAVGRVSAFSMKCLSFSGAPSPHFFFGGSFYQAPAPLFLSPTQWCGAFSLSILGIWRLYCASLIINITPSFLPLAAAQALTLPLFCFHLFFQFCLISLPHPDSFSSPLDCAHIRPFFLFFGGDPASNVFLKESGIPYWFGRFAFITLWYTPYKLMMRYIWTCFAPENHQHFCYFSSGRQRPSPAPLI